MQTRRISDISMISAIVALILGFSASLAQATSSKCVDNTTVEVCVEWSSNVKPVQGDNFRVTFQGSAGADLELLTGDPEWRLWTTLVSGGAATDFGDITLDPTVDNDDFTVRIYGDGEAGAVDVGPMVLDGSANPNWTGFSSIAGLSLISGDLGGLTLVERSGNGGVLDGLFVTGDLTGPLTVPTVEGLGLIVDDVIGDADVTIGEIDASSVTFDNLVCDGAVCPDITVTGKIFDGFLTVKFDVPSGSTIKIEELEEADPATGITVANMSIEGPGVLAGTLDLPNGLANPDTKIDMGGTFSGVIDLHGGAVAGEIGVYVGTTTAEIKNGGAVSGDVYLGENIPDFDLKYEGTATFASVTSTGEIGTHTTGPPAHFPGTLTVTGDMAGEVVVVDGSLEAGALIDIKGDMTGEVHIGLDCVGDIDIGGDATGDIEIDGDLSGSVIVVGALANGSLIAGGRILVAGESSGAIKVGEKTGTLTLIQVVDGLGTGATIEINTKEGAFNAEGDMHIGGATPAELPFDGCIRIYDQLFTGNYGDLKGDLDVVMCHDDQENLNICIDGSGSGNVTLIQTGCTYQTATWSCGTCP